MRSVLSLFITFGYFFVVEKDSLFRIDFVNYVWKEKEKKWILVERKPRITFLQDFAMNRRWNNRYNKLTNVNNFIGINI